jgi:hypothetical protein
MSANYHVRADWDSDARVWVSTSNIPGLVVEAETLPEFFEPVQALAPDLLADNAPSRHTSHSGPPPARSAPGGGGSWRSRETEGVPPAESATADILNAGEETPSVSLH